MPHFRGGAGSPFLSYYAYLGETPAAIGRTLVSRPQVALDALLTPTNAQMLVSLLLPLGLLPLLSPGLMLVALPTLVAYGLSTSAFMHRMEGFHYAATVLPWFTLAAVYGLGRWYDRRGLGPLTPVARRAPWLAVAVLLAASVGYQAARGFTPLSRLFEWPQVTAHERTGLALMKQIPPGASLVAQDRLYPHLSQREAISFLWPADASAEYILLDVSDPTLTNAGGLTEWLKGEILAQSRYGIVASEDGFVLLRRGAPPQPLSESFYSFATVDSPAVQHPLAAGTTQGIRLLGYDVVQRRYENTQFALYFTVTGPPPADYFVGLHLLNTDGSTIAKTSVQQPALVWHPTSGWQPGEVVKVVVNTPGWAEEPERFGLGVVLASTSAGGDPQDPDPLPARLKWGPVPGADPPRLLEDGTLLWLGEFRR